MSSSKKSFYQEYGDFLIIGGVAAKAVPYYKRHLEYWGRYSRQGVAAVKGTTRESEETDYWQCLSDFMKNEVETR